MGARYPRISCAVPFCRCGSTYYPPGYEILCPKHYRLVDRALKALRRRAKRAQRVRLYHACWRKMVRQAVERASGAG